MNDIKYFLGIDGGGSHTRGILLDRNGNMIFEASSGPSDAGGTPFETAISNLRCVMETLFESVGVSPSDTAVYAGVSGCGIRTDGDRYTEKLREIFASCPYLTVGSDILNPLYGSIGVKDGIIAICGTGSGACAHVNGQLFKVDFAGYVCGDAAGGYVLGRKVLNAAVRMADGRLKKTCLLELCSEKAGGYITEQVNTLEKSGKSHIASFAKIAFEAMLMGDPTAKKIVDESVFSMTENILTSAKYLQHLEKPIPVIPAGSLWFAADGYIFNEVRKNLGSGFELMEKPLNPAKGAAVYAAHKSGISDFL